MANPVALRFRSPYELRVELVKNRCCKQTRRRNLASAGHDTGEDALRTPSELGLTEPIRVVVKTVGRCDEG
jgi:hypothetical protein